jgi:hypothetical protein
MTLGVSEGRPTKKPRGRPKGSLGAKAQAIRAHVLEELEPTFDVITVRGVFYQCVGAGIVPKSESAGYVPIQRQLLALRREGLLRWNFISDSTRWQRKPRTWDSAEDALRSWQRTYRRNLWQEQDVRIEVWMEKDTLAGVFLEATEPWDVPLMVSRGQTSETFVYEAAQEARRAHEYGVGTHIFALYDSDTYGRNAARKVRKKLEEYSGVPIEYRLLAVTEAQIAAWNLPTRPDKKDGREVVELDAIPPDRLIGLVDDAISGLVDADAWEYQRIVEASERDGLRRLTLGGAA